MVRVSNGTTNVHLGILDSSFVAPAPKVGISHGNLVVTVRVLDAVDQMDDVAAEPDQFLAVVRLASRVPLEGLVSVNREVREVTRRGHEEPLALPLEQFVTATEG